ncbi:MAG: TIGR02996 domain-containing protein [Kofleriaceae bacterium]
MAELVSAIDDDPYDVEAYRVYADWLDGEGDPRGQLATMHLLAETLSDRHKLDHLKLRTAEHFERHRQHFLGPLARRVPPPTASRRKREAMRQSFQWRFGFIHAAAVTSEGGRRADAVVHILRELLEHASGRFLAELEISFPDQPQLAIDVLVQLAPPTLRAFSLLSRPVSLGALWPAVPRLRRLSLAYECELGAIELPELERASFGRLTRDAWDAVIAARWPALGQLEVSLVRSEVSTTELGRWFQRAELPALRQLGLTDGRATLELCRELAGSPLARQLTTLDLTNGGLTDDAARAWAALQPAPLDTLIVRHNPLSPDGVAALSTFASRVVIE